MYKNRTLEKKLINVSKEFPVVVLTGPRQVGKSTMLLKNKPANMGYVTLDDLDARSLALSDPKYFLESYGTPLMIDEIQYAPNLLSYIKIIVDKYQFDVLNGAKKRECLFWITGSQQFKVMKNVSESLAGRVAILSMNSFSSKEILGVSDSLFIPKLDNLKAYNVNDNASTKEIFNRIFKGGMPGIIANDIDRNTFFQSYLNTYIERDIKELLNVGKTIEFYNFMQYLAVRTSQELNYSTIAKEVGVDAKTIKSWISILASSGIIFLLNPFSSNLSSRLIKSPKLYFMDTGLCTFLAKYQNPEVLEAGALSGAIFETYVVSEIVKNYYNHGYDPNLYFYYYRDKEQHEVDLVYTESSELFPIEIKKGISPNHLDKNFAILDKYSIAHEGIVLCMNDTLKPINKRCWLCPIWYI